MRLALACLAVALVTSVAPAAHARTEPCVGSAAVDVATFRERVATIASKENDGRAPGSAGDTATRTLIVERFACMGLAPVFGTSYEQAFVADNKATTANVIGVLRGETDEIILVAAHHDHLGDGHLGANDNASGVVALLAVAEQLVEQGRKPKRTIVFAAFGDEETGMHGSYFYAAHPPDGLPTERIVQVIDLDMVGSHASRGFVAAMGTFKGMEATSLVSALAKNYPALNVGIGGKARGSDFEPFCKQGTPYVFFWTPDKRCYHERCDTADKLDYKRMVDIAKLAATLTSALADSRADLAAAKDKLGCFGKRR